MKPYHAQTVFNLEQEIIVLQEKEHRYQVMMASPLTSPEVRQRAQVELGRTINRIQEVNGEIARLRSDL